MTGGSPFGIGGQLEALAFGPGPGLEKIDDFRQEPMELNRFDLLADRPGLDARQIQQVPDQGDQPLGFFLGPAEQMLIGFRDLAQKIAQNPGQLFVDRGQRRAQFVGNLGYEFALEPIDDLHGGDVHHVDQCPEAFTACTAHRLASGHEKTVVSGRKFIRRDVFGIDVAAPGDVQHQAAERFIADVRSDGTADLRVRRQIEHAAQGRIDQHQAAFGVGDQQSAGQ